MTTEHTANELLYTAFQSLTPILKHCGISEVEATDILARSYAETEVLESKKRYNPTNRPEDSRALGTLISKWYTNVDYTNDMGEPRALDLDGGPGSLYALLSESLEEHKSNLDPKRAVEILFEHEIVEKVGNKFAIVKRHFTVGSAGASGANTLLNYITEFIKTTAINAIQDKDKGEYQRRAYCDAFPASRLPLLRNILEDQGMVLLESVDEAMENEAKEGKDEKTVRVSVGLYLYAG